MDDPYVGFVIVKFGPIHMNTTVQNITRELVTWSDGIANGYVQSMTSLGRPTIQAMSIGKLDLAEMGLKALGAINA